MDGEDFYTLEEAARILKLTPGRIRQILRAGNLEGIPPEEYSGRGWRSAAIILSAMRRAQMAG